MTTMFQRPELPFVIGRFLPQLHKCICVSTQMETLVLFGRGQAFAKPRTSFLFDVNSTCLDEIPSHVKLLSLQTRQCLMDSLRCRRNAILHQLQISRGAIRPLKLGKLRLEIDLIWGGCRFAPSRNLDRERWFLSPHLATRGLHTCPWPIS